jgi:Zn-dependent protease with chaperone function
MPTSPCLAGNTEQMKLLKKLLHSIIGTFIALVLMFEEWGWEQPRASLLVFGVPLLLMLGVKFLALFIFGRGQVAWGLVLLLTAKLVGTALLARLFQITRPALLKLPWFGRWYPRWKAWKDALLARVRQSALWVMGRRMKARLKAWSASSF